jgi:hypothetical protein
MRRLALLLVAFLTTGALEVEVHGQIVGGTCKFDIAELTFVGTPVEQPLAC